MALGVSLHNREPLTAIVHTLVNSGTTYLEIRAGTDDVTFFLSDKTAMQDAITILNAATELVKLVAEAQAAKVTKAVEAAESITL